MSPDARRVYEAIRRAGRHGVCRVDFELPDVLDGRKPILNFPGRIYEIKKNLGEQAVDWNGRRRGRCKVFVLGALVPASMRPVADKVGDYTCEQGHAWTAPCTYSQLGYPMLDGADPCPTCSTAPNSVEATKAPARPAAREKAAA